MKAGSNTSPTSPSGAPGTAAASPTNSGSAPNSSSGPAPSNTTIGHYIIGINDSNLILKGKALGKGTFGQVKQATHILTGEKVTFHL